MKLLKTTITRQLRFAHLYIVFRGRHLQRHTKFVILVHKWKINVEKINASYSNCLDMVELK